MNVPILVDPKGMSFEKYRGATFITPNSAEFVAICGDENDDISLTTRKAQTLAGELGLQGLIVTLVARGILWATNSEHGHQPALAKEVFDVSGAGVPWYTPRFPGRKRDLRDSSLHSEYGGESDIEHQ